MASSSDDTTTASFILTTGQPHGSPTGRCVIQNFRLIWLDGNIDQSHHNFQSSITQLRCIVNTIDTFTNADQCVDFLSEIKDEKTLMIMSDSLGEQITSLIHDISQLDSIFILCVNKTRHEQGTKNWPKVKGIFTEIDSLCQSIKQVARQCDQDSISVSFMSTDEVLQENLDKLDQSFMYTQILKEILFEINYNEQSLKDFISYCRDKYIDNTSELRKITKFEEEYHVKSPIWWYTYECFLYPMLNRALRTQEIDIIIKMGFFVRDLHQQIQELHSEQFSDYQAPFILYRGQGLSKQDFEKLTKTIGGLMSFNNFLSTSNRRDVSLKFATRASTNPDLVGILFKMIIDPSISTVPFALIDKLSYYQSEQEILFSMHSVFRIGEIKKLDNDHRLWEVELKLTTDNDQVLHGLTQKMREETRGSTGWHRLGQLLILTGQFDKAEEIYRVLFDQYKFNDIEKAHCFHQLGVIRGAQRQYDQAISFYEKTLEIFQKRLPPNHREFATCYNNLGMMHYQMGDYSKALSFFNKLHEICQRNVSPNYDLLANYYDHIGLVYTSMHEYSKALSFYEKALDVKQKYLPVNHPSLATSYGNIGWLYLNMGEFEKSIPFAERADKIMRRTLFTNHPDFQLMFIHRDKIVQELVEEFLTEYPTLIKRK